MYISTKQKKDHCPSCGKKAGNFTKKLKHNGVGRCSSCSELCACGNIVYDLIESKYLVQGAQICSLCEDNYICPFCDFECSHCEEKICGDCTVYNEEEDQIWCHRCLH